MSYQTLINSTIISKPSNKPNYTPKQSLKKAIRLVRKIFKTSLKHSKLQNEEIAVEEPQYSSEEECDNYENEKRELMAKSASN